MTKPKKNPVAWAWRVFWRRLVEAIKAKLAKLKAKLRGRRSGGGAAPARRRRPANPRCSGCELFVDQLCRKGCGVCRTCCPGHDRKSGGDQLDDRQPDQHHHQAANDDGKLSTSVEKA